MLDQGEVNAVLNWSSGFLPAVSGDAVPTGSTPFSTRSLETIGENNNATN
jgi:hypothetical protein